MMRVANEALTKMPLRLLTGCTRITGCPTGGFALRSASTCGSCGYTGCTCSLRKFAARPGVVAARKVEEPPNKRQNRANTRFWR